MVKIPNAYLASMCPKQMSSHFRISPYHSPLTMLETVQILHVKYMPATNTSASPTQTSDKSCKQRGEGWPAWSESDVPFVVGGGW